MNSSVVLGPLLVGFVFLALVKTGEAVMSLARTSSRNLFDCFIVGIALQGTLHSLLLQFGILTPAAVLVNWTGSLVVSAFVLFPKVSGHKECLTPQNYLKRIPNIPNHLRMRFLIALCLVAPHVIVLSTGVNSVQFNYDTLAYHIAQPQIALLNNGELPTDGLVPHAGLSVPFQLLSSIFLIAKLGIAINLFSFLCFVILVVRITFLLSRLVGNSGYLIPLILVGVGSWLLLLNPPGNLYNLGSDIPLTLLVIFLFDKVTVALTVRRQHGLTVGDFLILFFVIGFTYAAKNSSVLFLFIVLIFSYFVWFKQNKRSLNLVALFGAPVLFTFASPLVWLIPNTFRFGNPFFPLLRRFFNDENLDDSTPTIENLVRRSFSQFRANLKQCPTIRSFAADELCRDLFAEEILFYGLGLVILIVSLTKLRRSDDVVTNVFFVLTSLVQVIILFVTGPIIRYQVPFAIAALLSFSVHLGRQPAPIRFSRVLAKKVVACAILVIPVSLSAIRTREHLQYAQLQNRERLGTEHVTTLAYSTVPSDFTSLVVYVKNHEIQLQRVCLVGENRLAPFESNKIRAYPDTSRNPFTNSKIRDTRAVYLVLKTDGCNHLAYTKYWGLPANFDSDLANRFLRSEYCAQKWRNSSFVICELTSP